MKKYPFRCWLYNYFHDVPESLNNESMIFPEIKESMERASEFGLTALELAEIAPHNFISFKNFPKLNKKFKKEDLEKNKKYIDMIQNFCRECRSHKLDSYFFTFELSYFDEIGKIYPEALNPKRPLMLDIRSERLSETFKLFPDLTGIEVYLDEGPAVSVSHLGQYDMPVKEIIARLIITYLTVCRKYDKKFILSTFTNRAYRLRDIQAGLKLVPPLSNFYVNQWVVPGDLGEYLVHNPIIGDIGGHPEIITFDFMGENLGQCQVPFCHVDYLKERWTDALKRSENIIGYNGWALCSWNYHYQQKRPFILNTPNEINAFTLSCLAENPYTKTDNIWQRWTARCAGDSKTANIIKKALKRTQSIGEKAWMLKGFWFMEWPKSELPEIRYALLSPYKESSAEWDERLRPIEDSIFFPTEQFLNEIITDRKEAISLAKKSLDDIKTIEKRLAPLWRKELKDSLERLLAFCQISLYYTELFFRWKLWWFKRAGGEKKKINKCIKTLTYLAKEIESKFGMAFWPGNPQRVRLFIQEIKEMMNFGPGPLSDWSGLFLTPLAKRYVSVILDDLSVMAENNVTCSAIRGEEEILKDVRSLPPQEILKEVNRLKGQLLELKNIQSIGRHRNWVEKMV